METNIDRISELPDALILQIFSFLNMEDVKETCMLSKRWRYLWLSSPTLRIYDTYMSNDGDDFVCLNKFINFVDRILLLRDTSSDIQTLKLRWMNINVYLDRLKLMYDVSSRIATWIMAAVKHNVQELVVSLFTYQVIKLPDCFFTCKSLTKFKFTGFGRDVTDFVLPNNTMCFPHLRYLALTGVSVVGDENLTSKLLSSCPVLESLLLTDCSMKFDFSSLSLKHFVLDNCYTYESSDDYANTVKLSASNLTSLICKDYMSQDYALENLSSLVTADIGMIAENTDGYTPETPETYSKLATEVKELYGARMLKYVRTVRNVTDLTLSSPGFLEVVSGFLDSLDDSCFVLCNLRSLKVVTWVSKNCMNAITYLVKMSPNIKSIFLEIVKTELNTGGDWIVGSSFPCLHYLKSVEISGIQGCLNELKFLQVLLKKAIVLERVTLICYQTDSSDRAAQLLEFKEMLLAFPTASSSVAISIQS